jgi:putative transposase
VICTTNAIRPPQARFAGRSPRQGHSRIEQAALTCPIPARLRPGSHRKGGQRWTNRWNKALNAFDITLDGRLPASRT